MNEHINTITRVHKQQIQQMKDQAKHIAEKKHAEFDHFASVTDRTFADSLVTKHERMEWDKARQSGQKTKQQFVQFKRDKIKQYYKDKGEVSDKPEYVSMDNKHMQKLVNKHIDKIAETQTNETVTTPTNVTPPTVVSQ